MERELSVLVELYGNVVSKVLASIGRSEEDLLEAIDSGETTLLSGRQYLSADKKDWHRPARTEMHPTSLSFG